MTPRTFRHLITGFASASMLALGAHARAELELEANAGYGVPFGELREGVDLDRLIGGQAPLGLGVGYRLRSGWTFSAFGQYGFGSAGSDFNDGCESSGVDCSFSVVRTGLQLSYHFNPDALSRRKADPWFGAGVGYEWLNVEAEEDGVRVTGSTRGWEMFHLRAGVDLPVAKQFGLGPFVSYSFGSYTHAKATCSGPPVCDEPETVSGSVDDSPHQWLVFGVRAVLLL